MRRLIGYSQLLFGLVFWLPASHGQDIETYFVNKKFHLETTIPNESPEIECPVTEGKFPFPTEITLCFRSRPFFYIHHARTGFSWRTVITFGRMKGTKFEEGILFGVYYGGPWVGLKIPGTESIMWLFGGDALARFPFQVWRHTCISFNRETGRMRLVENGELWRDETTVETVEAMKKVSRNATIFTLGCMYWNQVNKYMSMFGSVTDAHVFGRALSDEEMIGWTSCSLPIEGDIISYKKAKWILRSPYNTTVKEVMDLKKDICISHNKSLVLVPQKLTFFEGLHQCSKLSGRLADYTEKMGFDKITRHISRRGNSNSDHCSAPLADVGRMVEVFLAVSDQREETKWRTWEGDKQVNHLPWAPNRPTKNGEANNCMLLKVSLEETEQPNLGVVPKKTDVIDESCFSFLCPLCVIDKPSMVFLLRGLCLATKFSKRFTFELTDEGKVRYMGDTTSMMYYDANMLSWILEDRREFSAKAKSTALEASHLIGSQEFDFSGVPNDECTSGGVKKIVRVKLTSCQDGQFTCSDGQCVKMDQRCDQIVQCRDESDEEDCRLLALKTSYNKKVPPIITVNASTFSPVMVKVSTVLLKVVAIVEIENKIDFQFTIVMQWKENRAKFNNLKQDTSLNALTDEEIYSLWLPKIIYDNTDQKEMTRLSSRQADAQWVRLVLSLNIRLTV